MTRIAVVGAGGTIAMQGAHPWDWVDYGDTGIIRPVAEVVAAMELGLPEVEIVPRGFRALPSTGIAAADWIALASELAGLGEFDGIVVTHGTATLEDTAFFLSLVLEPAVPVVVTGAQRPPNTVASDALPGLRAAIAAAASAPAGVYVSMNGALFDPARVTKTANHALDAFEAPETGPIGEVDSTGSLQLFALPAARPLRFRLPAELPRVDIALSYPGADGVAIDAFVAAGARGIVCAGFPPGRSTPGERAAMERAVAREVAVVQSSRAARGRVPRQAWNEAAGILSGGGLGANKARILLMLCLEAGFEREKIQALLLKWGQQDLTANMPSGS